METISTENKEKEIKLNRRQRRKVSKDIEKNNRKRLKENTERYKKREQIKEISKSLKKTDEDGINKLYYLKVKEKETTKIGDTTRDVKKRNEETVLNCALHIEERYYYEARYSDTHPNKKLRGKEFRDYDFHKFLTKENGYKREPNQNKRKSEWFYDITFEDFTNLLEEFICGKPKPILELRKGQSYVIEEIIKAWNDGYDFVNTHASMRIGKNVATLTTSDKKSYLAVYIGKNLTSQSSVEKDNEDWQILDEIFTFSIHGMESNSTKVNKIIDEIMSSATDKEGIAMYVDEADDQSHTEKSIKIIKKVYKKLKSNGYDVKLTTLSGTRPWRGEKILNAIKNKSDKVKNISISYNEMQILQPETTVQRYITSITVHSDTFVELSNISDSMKSAKGRGDLLKSIVMLVGNNDLNLKDTTKFPHWFIKFATVGKEKVERLVSEANNLYSMINGKKVLFCAINGDYTTGRESEEYSKEIIEKNPDTTIVFITQGMATTSYSIPSIGNTAVFTDNELTADDQQALARCTTWTSGKDWCNQIIVTTNDSKELKFHDVFNEELIGLSKPEKTIVMEEILSRNSLTYVLQNGYDCNSHSSLKVTKENVEKILIQKQKSLITRSSLTSLLMIDDSLDWELLEKIAEGKSFKTSKQSKTEKGKRTYPFGKPNKKKNPTNKMTMDRKQKIARGVVDQLILVPSLSKLIDKPMMDFDMWDTINFSKDSFHYLYDNNLDLQERLDDIYIACSEDKYLVEEHLNKYVG